MLRVLGGICSIMCALGCLLRPLELIATEESIKPSKGKEVSMNIAQQQERYSVSVNYSYKIYDVTINSP